MHIPRYAKNRDNTGRNITFKWLEVDYAPKIILGLNSLYTTVVPKNLEGPVTIEAETEEARPDDNLTILFTGGEKAGAVTFGKGFVSSGLNVGGGKGASVTFKFNGENYIEVSRFVQS